MLTDWRSSPGRVRSLKATKNTVALRLLTLPDVTRTCQHHGAEGSERALDTRFSDRRARSHLSEEGSAKLALLARDVERQRDGLGGIGGFKATVFFVALKPPIP